MTIEQAKALVAVLKAAFPRQEIEQETLDVYAGFLTDVDAVVGERAVKQLISNARFFPSIAEILEAVANCQYGSLPSPAEAWEMVERDWAPDYTFPNLPPIVERAFSLAGGSERFRYTEHMYAMRAQFLAAYADLRESTMARGFEGRRLALEQPEPKAELEQPAPELLRNVDDA